MAKQSQPNQKGKPQVVRKENTRERIVRQKTSHFG